MTSSQCKDYGQSQQEKRYCTCSVGSITRKQTQAKQHFSENGNLPVSGSVQWPLKVSQTDLLIWSVLHTTWRRHIDLLTEPSGISSAGTHWAGDVDTLPLWLSAFKNRRQLISEQFHFLCVVDPVSIDLCGLLFFIFLFIISSCSLRLLMNMLVYVLFSDGYFEKNHLSVGQTRLHLWVYDLLCSCCRSVPRMHHRLVLVAAGVSWPGGRGGPTPATGLSSSCPSGRGSLWRLRPRPAGEASSPPPWTPARDDDITTHWSPFVFLLSFNLSSLIFHKKTSDVAQIWTGNDIPINLIKTTINHCPHALRLQPDIFQSLIFSFTPFLLEQHAVLRMIINSTQ